MATKIYVGDIGTVITLDCGQDISAATARAILVRKPDGTTTSWAAAPSGTNFISYTTLAGTLDQSGVWKLQSHITLPSGARKGETANLPVYEAFQ